MLTEIPDPDFEDPKELYAFSGLALYAANLVEQSLVNIIVAIKMTDGTPLTPQAVAEIHSDLDPRTMGQLLAKVRKVVPVEESFDLRLKKALDLRNYLAHSFFVRHDQDLLSEQSRKRMILELRDMMNIFRSLDQELEEIYLPLWGQLGFSDEVLQQIHETQVECARQRAAEI